jgi:hypothetical protein
MRSFLLLDERLRTHSFVLDTTYNRGARQRGRGKHPRDADCFLLQLNELVAGFLVLL